MTTCEFVPFSNGEFNARQETSFVQSANSATECYLRVSRDTC
jgi:hypothetical protein